MPHVTAEQCQIVIDRTAHHPGAIMLQPVSVDKPLGEVVDVILGLARVLRPPDAVWYVVPPGQKEPRWG